MPSNYTIYTDNLIFNLTFYWLKHFLFLTRQFQLEKTPLSVQIEMHQEGRHDLPFFIYFVWGHFSLSDVINISVNISSFIISLNYHHENLLVVYISAYLSDAQGFFVSIYKSRFLRHIDFHY